MNYGEKKNDPSLYGGSDPNTTFFKLLPKELMENEYVIVQSIDYDSPIYVKSIRQTIITNFGRVMSIIASCRDGIPTCRYGASIMKENAKHPKRLPDALINCIQLLAQDSNKEHRNLGILQQKLDYIIEEYL